MMDINSDQEAWLGFSYFSYFGPQKLNLLLNFFPNITEAFWAKAQNLERVGLKADVIKNFILWRKKWNIRQVMLSLTQADINFLIKTDQKYPPLLKEITSAPPLLYYQGSLDVSFETKFLAVVGSRQPSPYSEKVINFLLPPLIKCGLIIISGLAVGVDSLAHRCALENGGATWAVLGSGLNRLYPTNNKCLAQDIVKQGGALWSEFPPDTPPRKTNFPRRNRIIAGLAPAVLIIEGGSKSGALITAYQALDQNRDLMAAPGNIFSDLSVSPNQLIKKGAIPITSPEDLLTYFNWESRQANHCHQIRTLNFQGRNFLPQDRSEQIIYNHLQAAAARAEILSADQIAVLSQLDISVINSKLSLMEINGIAQNDGFGYYLK